jgi:hypothetical protein
MFDIQRNKKNMFALQTLIRDLDGEIITTQYYWGEKNKDQKPHGWGSPSSHWKVLGRGHRAIFS